MNLKTLAGKAIVLCLLPITFSQCSKDSEILATFDGGFVTRREMNFVIEASKRGRTEVQPISADIQARIVESIALEKILLMDAVKLKKVDAADLTKIETLVANFLKLNVYMREYVKENLASKPLEFVNLQIALVRGEDEVSNRKRADELVTKLNTLSDSEIANEISLVTDDPTRKPVGGKLEPFCTNCAETPLEDILAEVKKAKTGKFIAYAKEGEGRIIYVVRSMGEERVHPERLNIYFTKVYDRFKKEANEYLVSHTDEESKSAANYFIQGDSKDNAKNFAGHTLKQYEQGLYESEIKRLREASGITVAELPRVFEPNQVDPKIFTPDYVLYSDRSGKNYTWKDLEADFANIPTLLKQPYKDDKTRIFDMLNLFQSTIIQGKIGENSKEVQSIGKETAYLMQMEKMKTSLALKTFQDEIKAIPVTVTEQQLRDSYEAGKLYAYADPDPKNPQNRIPKPYALVREQIKNDMENSQRNGFIEQKISGLKTTYNLKVAQDQLKEVIL